MLGKRIKLRADFTDGSACEYEWTEMDLTEIVRILEFEGKKVVSLWIDGKLVI
jgi:hypothetical protein